MMSVPSKRKKRWLPQLHRCVPFWNVMTVLVLVILLAHLFVNGLGGVSGAPELYSLFGLSWHSFSEGKIWQLVTYAFMHANWRHLGLNLVMLWIVGGSVYRILGARKWLIIFFTAIIAGGCLHLLASYWLERGGYPANTLVGVSGACVAMLLVLTTLSPDSRMWPIPVSGKNLGLGVIFAEMLLWLMQPGLHLPIFGAAGNVLVAMGAEGVFKMSHGCHLGGALVGWWFARRLLASPPSLEELQMSRKG